MEKDTKIYLSGHAGLVGSSLLRMLSDRGYDNILTRTRQEIDLTRQEKVEEFFETKRPQYVILAAAKVGGIHANSTYPAQFIYENLTIQANIIHASYIFGVKKLLFLGSACSYPRESPQPIREEYLLSGYLEPTNEPYAVAKIAGIKMCQAYNRQYGTNFVSIVPTNIYGPNDDFITDDSHVIPALIRKFHEAKIAGYPVVTVWGSGAPIREFIYVDDFAEACLFLMHKYNESEVINVGSGEWISIKELVYVIKEIIGYEGNIAFDKSKNDGIPKKVLDISRLKKLGWQAKTTLTKGIRITYNNYIERLEKVPTDEKSKF